MPDRLRLMLRWVVTLALIVAVFWHLDQARIWAVLRTISPMILLPVFLLTVVQVVVSAWRWRFTLSRLRLSLPLGQAVREYYLATFLNQILPGGVAGDINRAWRSSLETGQRLAAVHGVAIERLSGQVTLAVVVVVALAGLLVSGSLQVTVTGPDSPNALLWIGAGLVILVPAVWLFRSGGKVAAYVRRLTEHLRLALWQWPALPVQVLSSCLVLASYLAVFLLLAASAGFVTGAVDLLLWAALGSFLLLSMVVPLTVAGWGVREGAAAVLWPMAGLPAEQGVAISVGYGVVVLISSLPGLVVLARGTDINR
ncbi:lysylphosphatidylglycerol synthase transmembrane domain-containing protein [Marinobacter sp.]|uniref:lysylphosphatidylglycerol synthase transmembrane domain-containing protein n=1 Tax=Marinobacter sp. TaxID=50741 RepID=UPI0035684CBC